MWDRLARGKISFVAASLLILLLWGWVLPWLAGLDQVRDRIGRQEKAGIDPSAMFYSELGGVSGVRLRHRDGRWEGEEFTIGDPQE